MNISKEYDRLYQEGVELFKLYNPCDIKNGKCATPRGDFCCYGCTYLGPNGCRVKALYCKLWYCCYRNSSQKGEKYLPNEFYKKLRDLQEQARRLGIFFIRTSKTEALKARKNPLAFRARYGRNNM